MIVIKCKCPGCNFIKGMILSVVGFLAIVGIRAIIEILRSL